MRKLTEKARYDIIRDDNDELVGVIYLRRKDTKKWAAALHCHPAVIDEVKKTGSMDAVMRCAVPIA